MKNSVSAAKFSVYSLFFCFGFCYLTLLSRIVKLRELLGNIEPSQTSLILVCISAGSIATAPIAGLLLDRMPIKTVVRVTAVGVAFVMFAIGLFATMRAFSFVLLFSFCFGSCACFNNIAINLAGVSVEKAAKKTLLPRFHAFFCVGSFCTTAVSFLFAIFNAPLIIHFASIALISIIIVNWQVSRLLETPNTSTEPITSWNANGEVVRIPKRHSPIDLRLILIGVIVMASTFAEGSGNDWITSAVAHTGHSEALAILPLWFLQGSQTLMRLFGTHLVDKVGRGKAIRLSFICTISGVVIFAFAPWFPLFLLATTLWGLGVALGYPLGISAASESGINSSFRSSVVAAIGSAMNIAGPPVIGILGDLLQIRHALLITLPALVFGIIIADKAMGDKV